MMVAELMIAAGIGILITASIITRRRTQPRVTGFSSDDIEMLTMPAHERLARQLAKFYGAPSFMWRRYTPLAVSIIIRGAES
jgi:hypothetical protein